MVNGGVKGRILAIKHDPYGRWTLTTYRQNCGTPLTIIVTYQVVTTDPQRTGPTTYATQLFALYTKEGQPNPTNLRQRHASDLVKLVKEHQTRGEWIIIAGDMNEVLRAKAGGMTRLHTECGLVDACLEKHGTTEFSREAIPYSGRQEHSPMHSSHWLQTFWPSHIEQPQRSVSGYCYSPVLWFQYSSITITTTTRPLHKEIAPDSSLLS